MGRIASQAAPGEQFMWDLLFLRVDEDEDLALVLSTKILEQRFDTAWIGVQARAIVTDQLSEDLLRSLLHSLESNFALLSPKLNLDAGREGDGLTGQHIMDRSTTVTAHPLLPR